MGRYLHVGFNFEGKLPDDKKLKSLFDQANDWVRYAPDCWIIYTTETAQAWSDRLRKALSQEYTILIFEISLANYTGWATKIAIDWLRKSRS